MLAITDQTTWTRIAR